MKGWRLFLLGVLVSCSGGKGTSDTAADVDADAVADGDGHGVADDDDIPASPVAGEWEGLCTNDGATTGDTGASIGDLLGIELRLNLTETGGVVEGGGVVGFQTLVNDGIKEDSADTALLITTTYTWTTDLPIEVAGSWDGKELVLVFAESYGGPLPLEFTGILASDHLTGELAFYPQATEGDTVLMGCSLYSF